MGFEFIVGAAVGKGRTLVLPPLEGWYLLDYGPLEVRKNDKEGAGGKWLNGETRSQTTDFWDVEDLKKVTNPHCLAAALAPSC